MTMGMDALKLLNLGHLKLDIPSQGIRVYVMTCCGPLLGQKFFKHWNNSFMEMSVSDYVRREVSQLPAFSLQQEHSWKDLS